jgi:hypothetical protein
MQSLGNEYVTTITYTGRDMEVLNVRILYKNGIGLQPQLGRSPLGFGEAQP